MKYIAFLRGINVGGHHKVPMQELRKHFADFGFENVTTLLNSGNVVFDTKETDSKKLENKIETFLSKTFGFSIPVLLIDMSELQRIVAVNPFKQIKDEKDIRLYVSFLKQNPTTKIKIPWFSDDKSFQIIKLDGKIICSILDLSITKTPKGMDELEKMFGKEITTRNWNTIVKIAEL